MKRDSTIRLEKQCMELTDVLMAQADKYFNERAPDVSDKDKFPVFVSAFASAIATLMANDEPPDDFAMRRTCKDIADCILSIPKQLHDQRKKKKQ